MADKLADLFPVAITFQDGESPAPGKLNTWASQTDSALLALERLIGDAFHESEGKSEATYLTNVVRAIGRVGDVQARIPTNATFRYRQDLPIGLKEFDLRFMPKNPPPLTFTTGVGAPAVQNAAITDNNAGGWEAPTANRVNTPQDLTTDGQWTITGKRVRTAIATAAGDTGVEYVEYEVDPTTFVNGYGVRNGPNVVPNIAQISQNVTTGPPLTFHNLVCTITDNGAKNYTIQLPLIKWYDDRDGTLVDFQLANDGVVGTIPRYAVPGFWGTEYAILNPADNIPEGLVQLWFIEYNGAGAISRLRPVQNNQGNNPIVYSYTDRNTFILQLPAEMDALDLGTHASRHYIATFGGYGLAAAIKNLMGFMQEHAHDGSDESVTVPHAGIGQRFSLPRYTESTTAFNDHPQYLLREGYNHLDPRNADNSMIGDLHLGSQAAPTDMADVDDFSADDSYKLLLGPVANLEGIYYDEGTDGPGWQLPTSAVPTASDDGGLWFFDTGNDSTLYLGTANADINSKLLYLRADASAREVAVGATGGAVVLTYDQTRTGYYSWDCYDAVLFHNQDETPPGYTVQYPDNNGWEIDYVIDAPGAVTPRIRKIGVDAVNDSDVAFTVPLKLPHGVTVTEMEVLWSAAGALRIRADIVRQNITNGIVDGVGARASERWGPVTMNNAGAAVTLQAHGAVPVGLITDLQSFSYHLHIRSTVAAEDTQSIHGGRITYTYKDLVR